MAYADMARTIVPIAESAAVLWHYMANADMERTIVHIPVSVAVL